jgi:hypothetical protein
MVNVPRQEIRLGPAPLSRTQSDRRQTARGLPDRSRRIDMTELEVSSDTSLFEVPAVLDEHGRLADHCVRKALTMMDVHGLVVLTGLLSDAEADAGLALMRETQDGFRIAEEDLKLRGAGELLGTRQSGENPFRVATPEQVRAYIRARNKAQYEARKANPNRKAQVDAASKRYRARKAAEAMGAVK